MVPSVVDMLKMLGILVGMDQKDSDTARLWPRSPSTFVAHRAGFAGLDASMLCSLVCLRPVMPGIMVGGTLRNALFDCGYILCVSPGLDEFPTLLRADGFRIRRMEKCHGCLRRALLYFVGRRGYVSAERPKHECSLILSSP